MRIYIAVDIEGICGACDKEEFQPSHTNYARMRDQMTAEAAAACEGAQAAGATDIVVKDAHGNGRTIDGAKLPQPACLIRGWSNEPLAYAQVQGLDASFAAVVLVGYHARAGASGNPLSHTWSSVNFDHVALNGRPISEAVFTMHAAAQFGVPVVFLSGDADVCAEVKAVQPAVTTVAVLAGHGDSTTNLHPHEAVDRIRAGVEAALKKDPTRCHIELPERFELVRRYRDHRWAYRASFYPGAQLLDPQTVTFEADEFDAVLRFCLFT
jgi:D-amino peptidase